MPTLKACSSGWTPALFTQELRECFRRVRAEHSHEEILADCDLTTARKGKTMTKPMTGDSEVERDLRKMKTTPQALTERTMTDFNER